MSNDSADAPPKPRALAPKVGLQRWVLPLLRGGSPTAFYKIAHVRPERTVPDELKPQRLVRSQAVKDEPAVHASRYAALWVVVYDHVQRKDRVPVLRVRDEPTERDQTGAEIRDMHDLDSEVEEILVRDDIDRHRRGRRTSATAGHDTDQDGEGSQGDRR